MQVLVAAGLRPQPHLWIRRVWNIFHWTLGRIALALGITNLYIGTAVYGVSPGYYIALSAILGSWLAFATLKDYIDYLHLPLASTSDAVKLSRMPLMMRGDRYNLQKTHGPVAPPLDNVTSGSGIVHPSGLPHGSNSTSIRSTSIVGGDHDV